ncbi:MAG TPA: ABC transporter permease [Puia sp.]|jgi:predicted permease|nr:ABC transporter permease [Puia sp.]
MFKNSLKLAWRNLLKDRLFTLLNLVGLATGLACTLLIYLWVNDELHMDRFNSDDSRLYQVMKNSPTPTGIETVPNTPGLLASTLARQMPDVEYAVAVIPPSWFDRKGIITYQGHLFEASGQFAGKDFFNVFSYDLLRGNREEVMKDKGAVLISDDLARRVFGSADDVVGKSIEWNQKDFSGVYPIAGVFRKPSANSTSQFDVLFNYDLFVDKYPKMTDWGNSDPSSYVVLKPGTDAVAFDRKIAGLIKANSHDSQETLFMQKFSDKYLHNHYENGAPSGGRIEYVRLFSIIAAFILVIACVNFMNLSTAKAVSRMKETGIKKVIGAPRYTLILQYLSESLLMSFLSALVAVGMVLLVLPQFNTITGKDMHPDFGAGFILTVLAITLMTGIIAGSYPAIYLSSFQPAAVLKGKLKSKVGEMMVRKALVVFQFTLSGIFIIAVLVIYRQMQLVQTINLGYNRDHLVYFDKGGMAFADKQDYAPGGRYEASLDNFLQRVRSIPGVATAANFRHNITDRNGGTYDLSWPGKDPNSRIDFTDLGVGYGFIETMGIQMLEGRPFSRDFGSDRSSIIFNETAIKKMGIKDPVGKVIHVWGEDRQIIGVVKDFHFQSLYENIKPCFFDFTFNQRAAKIMVRLKAGQEKLALDGLERLYREENPGIPFEYKFLDDDYQALYASEKRVAALSRYFAGLAVIISSLGLFGLSAFMAQKRQKEIGIRKVIGASTGSVVLLLSKDFVQLLLIAILVAFPVSGWVMDHWLKGFAYRVPMKADIFLIAGLLICFITLLSVSFQSVRAAISSPIRSIRTDG